MCQQENGTVLETVTGFEKEIDGDPTSEAQAVPAKKIKLEVKTETKTPSTSVLKQAA